MNASEKAVLPNTTLAPLTALMIEEGSSTSPFTISMPLLSSALLAGFVGSRVTPRIFHPGSLRKTFATEEP
jgi:hypothetical protein